MGVTVPTGNLFLRWGQVGHSRTLPSQSMALGLLALAFPEILLKMHKLGPDLTSYGSEPTFNKVSKRLPYTLQCEGRCAGTLNMKRNG